MRHQLLLVVLATFAASGCSRSPAPAPGEKIGSAVARSPVVAPPAAPRAIPDPTFIPSDGRYSVIPPTSAAPKAKEVPDPNGGTWRELAWNTRDGLFAVQGRTYGSPAEASVETDAFIPTRVANEIEVDRRITVSNHPARELRWSTRGLTIHARFVIDDTTVWKVVVGGKGGEPAGASAFLESFQVRSLDLDTATIAAVHLHDGAALGPADAPVTIAIFQDAMCSYCTRAFAALDQTRRAHPGKVRVVLKQMPLPTHKNADLAAEAMLAANAQGKLAEMHDALVAHPTALAREDLVRYASEAHLDVARFTTELDGHTYAAAVQADSDTAKRLYVTGTPTVYINGKRIVGLRTAEVYEREIGDALAHSPARG